MRWTPESVLRWSEHAGDSPLYFHLSRQIAADTEMMRVLNRIEHTPPINILFAAVQLILSRRPDEPLTRYYASLTPNPLPPDGAMSHFRRVVLDNEEEIAHLGVTRYTQTNECARALALLPGVWAGPHDRFHLVDIGASAGLNLALDRYRYRWGTVEWGESPLLLECDSRGADPAPREISVGRRFGLDLHPMDPANADDREWLEALVWPEATARLDRLRAALDLVAEVPIEMIGGDAVQLLPSVLDSLPGADPVVVMDSFTINQFTPEQKEELEAVVSDARGKRPVHRVSFGLMPGRADAAALRVDDGSGWRVIGEGHHHGAWLQLYVLP